MNDDYRLDRLTLARREYETARREYDAEPTWNIRKQTAAEALEFWGNKLAFLAHAK